MTKDSTFFEEHQRTPHPIPLFRFEEVELGELLGIGGFSTVKEIRKITLTNDDNSGRKEDQKENGGEVSTDNDAKNDESDDDECLR